MLGYDLVYRFGCYNSSQVNYTGILGDDEGEDSFRSWGH